MISEKDYDNVINFILPRYKLNEWIYPSAISRNCDLDKDTTATILNELVKKKCLNEHWLIRCPYCRKINTDRIYVHYESVPAWFICSYCDREIKAVGNDSVSYFADYAEPVYQIRSK